MRPACAPPQLFLLILGITLASQPEDFVVQAKSQCYYRDGTRDVRFMRRFIYNQEEFVYFDSDKGIFIAKTELGRPDAECLNSDPEVLAAAQAAVETICKHNYQVYKPAAIDRKAEPKVKIIYTPTSHPEYENILTCYVDSFFPPMINVTWLKNGVVEPEQVISTELLNDGDWTYQIHVHLETTMQLGDTFTCRVEHSSLAAPMEAHWKFETSDSARHKKLTGIVGIVLGLVFFIVGLIVYLHNKKGFEFLAVRQDSEYKVYILCNFSTDSKGLINILYPRLSKRYTKKTHSFDLQIAFMVQPNEELRNRHIASADYVNEVKSECHYMNGTQKVRYLVRVFYNQEEFLYFDSDVGYYIAKTEFGRPDAEYLNKNKDFIEQLKAQVQIFCEHNYDIIHGFTADRRVEPKVRMFLVPQFDEPDAEHHILQCTVYGFFPSEIEVKWYRNGEEETSQVQQPELLLNGDWTFQLPVMLLTEIKRGDVFTCEVHHQSLKDPLRVDWHPQTSDSAKSKMATGIVGFVLGAVFIIAGILVYMRGRKVQNLFRGPQTENFIQTLPE
ncbi:uncharacterized protein PAF06_020104 [Gastrophryne carolinensis]